MHHYEAAIAAFGQCGDELEKAISYNSALLCLSLLGDNDRASRWAQRARVVFEEQGDRIRLARLGFNYANILFRRDRWEEAAELYREAYVELKEIGNPSDVAACLSNMAVCHLSLHDFQEAYSLYGHARTFCKAHGLAVSIAKIDYNIAYLFYLRGEYTEALDRYEQARATCLDLGDRYHLNLCALDEAEIFLELNLTSEGLELARDAYSGFQELHIRYEAAKALALWGICLSRQGKWFLALELLGQAREIFVTEDNLVWVSQIDLHRALVLLRVGRTYEASKHSSSALQGFIRLDLATKAAVCDLAIARCRMHERAWEAASEKVADAFARLEELDAPTVKYQAHFLLGEIRLATGDRASALAEYKDSHTHLEQVRSHLRSEEFKVPLLDDKLLVYERLFSQLAGSDSTAEQEEAFQFLEKAKARSIADLVASRVHAMPPRTSGRSNLASAVRQLREELNWYYRQIDLQEMRSETTSPASLSPLRQASREREDRLLHSLGQLQATDQELSSLQEAFTVDLQAIRSTLPPDTSIVDYYMAGTTVFAVVIDRDRMDIVAVSVVSKVQDLQRSLRFQLAKFEIGLEDPDRPSKMVNTSVVQLLASLNSELIDPVASYLTKPGLLIMPHGFLHHLPFHALFDGESFLCDRHTVTYSPSATVSHLLGIRPASLSMSSMVLGIKDPTSEAAKEEIERVANATPLSETFQGPEANEEVFLRLAPTSRYIHLSSKSQFRQDNAMFSSIELAGRSLNLFDLFNLQLDAELFSITGCGPPLGNEPKGDEFLGLARGLLYAGARSILLPLWNPDQESVTRFMASFYEALQAGRSKTEALRETMREMRERDANPFRWAAFVLIGEPG